MPNILGIPSLAFAVVIIVIFIVIAAFVPPIRDTFLAFLNAIFGGK